MSLQSLARAKLSSETVNLSTLQDFRGSTNKRSVGGMAALAVLVTAAVLGIAGVYKGAGRGGGGDSSGPLYSRGRFDPVVF